jgi:hypothetical protein
MYTSLNQHIYRRNTRNYGASALLWAAVRGRPNTARKVFELCDGLEVPAFCLRNALVLAIENCSWTVMRVLVANGADPNTTGTGFGHVLEAASWKGDIVLVQSLLDAGAEVGVEAGHYGNALQAAAWNGHEDTVTLLLHRGADVNAPGGHYGSALQAASWAGHRAMVKLLISHGALVSAECGFYGSALQAASWRGDTDIMRTLLGAGAVQRMGDNAFAVALKRPTLLPSIGLLLTSIFRS